MIKVITSEQSKEIVNRYIDKRSLPEDEGLFISFDNDKFIALANECGDCYVEEFYSLELAITYLLGNYEDINLLYSAEYLAKDMKNEINK